MGYGGRPYVSDLFQIKCIATFSTKCMIVYICFIEHNLQILSQSVIVNNRLVCGFSVKRRFKDDQSAFHRLGVGSSRADSRIRKLYLVC